jgi:hypothetical protein
MSPNMSPEIANDQIITQEERDLHLDEDSVFATTTKYCIISFCSSKSRQKISDQNKVALKVRGAFSSVDEAVAHVKLLPRTLDAYVMEMYKWTLIGNVVEGMNVEDHLTDMIRAHKQANVEAKAEFETRKKTVQEKGLEAYDEAHESNAASYEDVTEAGDGAEPDAKIQKKHKEPLLTDIKPVSADSTSDDSTMSLHDIDSIRSGDFQFCVISIVERDPTRQRLQTPEGCIGIKVRGAFATRKECEEHIEKLGQLDTENDMYVVDMYKFLMLPPDKDNIETKYREEYLQDLFSTYKESQETARAHLKDAEAKQMKKAMETPVHPTEIKAMGGASTSDPIPYNKT